MLGFREVLGFLGLGVLGLGFCWVSELLGLGYLGLGRF